MPNFKHPSYRALAMMIGLWGSLTARPSYAMRLVTPDAMVSAEGELAIASDDEKQFKIESVADALSEEKVARERLKEKKEMLKGGMAYNNGLVKQVYDGFYFPKMTTAGTSEVINTIREQIFADLYEANKSDKLKPENRAEFHKIVFDMCVRGLEKSYHPATRVNCMLIIGQMDEKLPAKNTPPVPYRDAMKTLFKEVAEPTSEGTLAAALNGLERHVRLGAGRKGAQSEAISKALMKIITDATAVARPPQVHSFIQRRCLDILQNLEGNDYLPARDFMLSVAGDANAEHYLRGYCLKAIGTERALKGQAPEKLNSVLVGAFHYVHHEIDIWMKRLNETGTSAETPGGNKFGGGKGGMGGMGMGGGLGGGEEGGGPENRGGGETQSAPGDTKKEAPIDYQDVEIRRVRRAISTIIESARTCVDGAPKAVKGSTTPGGVLANLEGDDAKVAEARDVVKAIDNLYEALNYSGPDGAKKIKDMATLKKLLDREFKKVSESMKPFPEVLTLGLPPEMLKSPAE